VKLLFEQQVKNIEVAVNKAIGDASVAQGKSDGICHVKLFHELETEKDQDHFWTQHINFVKPKSVKLLSETVNLKRYKQGYVAKTVNRFGYYVPFTDQLKAVLSMPKVRDLPVCDRADQYDKGIMRLCDGAYVLHHPFVHEYPDAPLIGIYTDDFKLANPVGSHRKKHKITAFYWTLLNIPMNTEENCQLFSC
jgi:hypothetical protein